MKYPKVKHWKDIYDIDDWRIMGQPAYLYAKTLCRKIFQGDINIKNDHRHCEFCFSLFSNKDNYLHWGYYDPESSSWICEECFNDFEDMFDWSVADSGDCLNTK